MVLAGIPPGSGSSGSGRDVRNLVVALLQRDPRKRLTASAALRDAVFLRDAPALPTPRVERLLATDPHVRYPLARSLPPSLSCVGNNNNNKNNNNNNNNSRVERAARAQQHQNTRTHARDARSNHTVILSRS